MTRIFDRSEAIQRTAVRTVLTAILATGALYAGTAHAAGTTAGTTISNTATATFTDMGGNPQSIDSNTVEIKVDELIDVVVDATDPGDVQTVPGATGQVMTYKITNTGNGSEAFTLTANGAMGGDDFDPTAVQIFIDNPSAGTPGVYDPGVDTLYTPGTNDPVLAADASVTVFVVSTIPSGVADGNKGIVELSADAKTGTGAPGTSFAGLGDGGTDAVVGTTGGDAEDVATFLVQNATLTFNKSASVLDPFGGAETVPGAIITYTLVATVSGTGQLANVVIGDAIPASTTYQPGTITVQATGQTDAADADAGAFSGTAISASLGNVPAGSTRTVTFKVKVN